MKLDDCIALPTVLVRMVHEYWDNDYIDRCIPLHDCKGDPFRWPAEQSRLASFDESGERIIFAINYPDPLKGDDLKLLCFSLGEERSKGKEKAGSLIWTRDIAMVREYFEHSGERLHCLMMLPNHVVLHGEYSFIIVNHDGIEHSCSLKDHDLSPERFAQDPEDPLYFWYLDEYKRLVPTGPYNHTPHEFSESLTMTMNKQFVYSATRTTLTVLSRRDDKKQHRNFNRAWDYIRLMIDQEYLYIFLSDNDSPYREIEICSLTDGKIMARRSVSGNLVLARGGDIYLIDDEGHLNIVHAGPM
jgi:hypothetical protein